MSIKNLIILALCLIALAACASKGVNNMPLKTNGTLSTAKQEQALLAFSDSFSNLSLDAQKKAFMETNLALTANKSDVMQRVKLAMMLALPSSQLRDLARAQNILQELSQENGLSLLESAMTNLLHDYTLESIKQLQRSKEDAKKLDIVQQKNVTLEQKNATLEQKLNSLKDIERTMIDRDAKPVFKPSSKP